jgi:hypothetical protein
MSRDDHEPADVEDDVQPSRLLQARERLKAKARTFVGDMKISGMSLRINEVKLPNGFIPPYLAKEKKPQETVLWDSRLEPFSFPNGNFAGNHLTTDGQIHGIS